MAPTCDALLSSNCSLGVEYDRDFVRLWLGTGEPLRGGVAQYSPLPSRWHDDAWKDVVRDRLGSGSRVGMPVADVVVVIVDVDIRRMRLAGTLRRRWCGSVEGRCSPV
jgi:hypothetical protein